ncbi:MAG: polysaccharide deacetylase family protein, partial [bacterium]
MRRVTTVFLCSTGAILLTVHASLASHSIARWRDNRSGAVSVTFDDGTENQVLVGAELLNQRGLKGSFYVITDSGNETNLWNQWPTYWQDWATLAAQGHEIGSHTVSHQELTNRTVEEVRAELSISRQVIDSKIPSQICLTFSYPFGSNDALVRQLTAEYYIAARTVWSPGNLNFYPDDPLALYPPVDFFAIGSVHIDSIAFADLHADLDAAESSGSWLVSYMHRLDTVEIADFLAQYLDDLTTRDLWVAPLGVVARYMQERIQSALTVVSRSPSSLTLSLTNDLPASIYDVQLTLRSTVPLSWGTVQIDQGASWQVVEPVIESGISAVYYNALPNGGPIMLHPMVITNLVPEVDAGPDRITTLPSGMIRLDGIVDDDGLPGLPLSVSSSWILVSGPAAPVFRNATAPNTIITLPVAGVYVLRLTASDGALTASDDVTIVVQPSGTVTTGDFVVAASQDDAEEGESGYVYLASSDLELVNDTFNLQGDQTVGIRFQSVTIPSNAALLNAWIQFTTKEATTEPAALTIHGQATDNASPFLSVAGNVSGRSRTGAEVEWTPAAWTAVSRA